MGTYSIAAARSSLPSIVHGVEAGGAVTLTRRGKPVAMIVGIQTYERLVQQRKDLWTSLQAFRASNDFSDFDMDGLFNDVRDRSEGRQCDL